ncbi:tetratricopeptide repeat protein [Rubrivivax gelatinosus]|uniref:Tetratricopeptide repeat protein n=3 Tax=Rubrivivax gelatinosus TaxID=28068 RepID=A0A4R2MBB5_RUBGE|nr:tetratricopeptide repeat protein [Rubrivivax gelatinosus]TCP01827.1 tetratricopeptide repeat protein [Rubrivivax gelatinosus]
MPRPPASVVAALEAALQQSPDDLDLRQHLAQLLHDDERPEAALELCVGTLARDPAHLPALRLAAPLARQLGRSTADGYARLLAALEPAAPPPAAAPAPRPAPVVATIGAPSEPQDLVRGERPGLRLAADGGERVDEFEVQAPSVSFAQIGGMEGLKKKLELSVLGPLRDPELYRAFGKTGSGGLLLYGPPGCGKTYIARALAGEMGARFASVGLEDVLDMWFGESEQRLHKIFDSARRLAPMVLFFDEVDALGHKRSELRGGAGRNLVNQLLSEMDGAQHDNTDVFVLGATNHPWDVDSALRRPGRFDRTVLVLPPDVTARERILEHHLEGCPHAGVDLPALARATELFSGADLAHLCNLAREAAIEASAAAGRIRPVGHDDFRRALKTLRPSTLEWFAQARNFAMFANESGVYDELLDYMKRHRLG